MPGKNHYSGAHPLQAPAILLGMDTKNIVVMVGKEASELKRLFYRCAEMNDLWLGRSAVMPDYIDMLIQLPPSISVATAVQILKDGQ